jgi:hypothetical protein
MYLTARQQAGGHLLPLLAYTRGFAQLLQLTGFYTDICIHFTGRRKGRGANWELYQIIQKELLSIIAVQKIPILLLTKLYFMLP